MILGEFAWALVMVVWVLYIHCQQNFILKKTNELVKKINEVKNRTNDLIIAENNRGKLVAGQEKVRE